VKKKQVVEDPLVCSTNDIVCWMWPKGVASSIEAFQEDREESEDIENPLLSARYSVWTSIRCIGRRELLSYLKAKRWKEQACLHFSVKEILQSLV